MARAALPQSKLKLRKRRRRVRIGLLLVLLALVVAGGCIAALYAPFWRISHLSVMGSQSVAQEAIEGQAGQLLAGTYFYVIPKDNILFYPKHALAAMLKSHFSALASVEISMTSLTSISITVAEYGPYALWCGESSQAPASCLLMDKNGVAYAPAVSVSGNVYVRYYGSLGGSALPRQYLTTPQFHTLTALLAEIGQKVQGALTSVAVDYNGDAHALFDNGFTLIFSLNDDAAQTLGRFTLGLSAEPFTSHALSDFEYLDLRFGDKLYYKLKS